MGGNIFKDKSRRYSKADYVKLKDSLFGDIKSLLGDDHYIKDTRSLHGKKDFGDLDVIISKRNNAIQKIFNNQKILNIENKNLLQDSIDAHLIKNSPVIINSYLATDFQVDFIFCDEEILESSYNYLSWNDLGNFIGKVSRSLGYKFGHHGLIYRLFDGDNLVGDIVVSSNINEILEFLDFNYEDFEQGFNEISDMHNYVISSKFAQKKLFSDDRYFKSRDKTRIAKRPSFKKLIYFLAELDDSVFNDKIDHNKDDGLIYGLNYGFNFFDDFKANYNSALIEYRDCKESMFKDSEALKLRYGSKKIMELTGRTGGEIGILMEALGKEINPTNLSIVDFIAKKSDQQIESWIMDRHNSTPMTNKRNISSKIKP